MKSTYLANRILDHVAGGPDYVRPATLYVALFTVAPNPGGGGTEVTGGSYSRVALLNNATNFPAASLQSKTNGTVISFTTPTAGWGTITHFALFDASTGGNMIHFGNLTIPKTIDSGDLVTFPIGELVITEA